MLSTTGNTPLPNEKVSRWFWFSVISLFVFRVVYLPLSGMPLFYDEAYYHYWAENLAWGYFSKPPMVAWVIAFTTGLFGGSTELTVKLGAPLLYALTAIVVFFSSKQMFNHKVAELSALVFITAPLVTFNSMFITTDAPLLFFWSLAMWSFIQAIHSDRMMYWLLLGVTLGLGLLSKYTMIVLLLGMLAYFLFEQQHRRFLAKPGFWVAIVLALLLFMPNVYWNYQYDFISFQHTSEISKLQQSLVHPERFLEFFGGQFLVFGPISMWLMLVYWRKAAGDPVLRILLYMTMPLFIIICVQAFLAKANLNWAAPTYVAGSILVGHALVSTNKTRLAKIAIGINLIVAATLYFYSPLQGVLGVEPSKKNALYYRLAGWEDLMQSAVAATDEYADLPWVSDSRKLLSYGHFYITKFSGKTLAVFGFNPDNHIKSQFELTRDIRNTDASEFMFVSEYARDLSNCFEESGLHAHLQEQVYSTLTRQLYIYHVKGFKGYGYCQDTD